ncbi:MAG: hypothetical protein A3J83_03865 [Elusimicrobia bacterium RIFOXYA2_FULL_40_6]|nr:MAG: hypothetical protein A3J83_03865 [Elusimicrobia bacterium RIFOXYA2_FULL_40_6]
MQKLVLATNSIKILNLIYKNIYKSGLNLFIKKIKNFSQIKSVYLRRGLTAKDWIPGSSDIDLFVLIEEQETKDEIIFLKAFWGIYNSIKKYFPFFGEVQIANEREFRFYRRHGGIRAADTVNWQLLHGQPFENTADNNQFNALSEIFNSYLILSNNYFAKNSINNRETNFKAFADIMRYSLPNEELSKLPRSRKEFIELFYKNTPQTLPFAINHLDKYCREISNKLQKDNSDKIFSEITAPGVISNKEAEQKCIQIETKTGLKGISVLLPEYSYLPSYMFVILTETDNLETLTRYLKYDLLSANHGKIPVILTQNMFNCLLNCLFFSSPFNYFTFKSEWSSFPELKVKRPEYETLFSMAKECAANMAVSIRMNEHSSGDSSVIYTLYSTFGIILKLHLALDKKIIVSGPVNFLIETYIENYPESSQWLAKVKTYFAPPLGIGAKYDINDVFYRNYPHLKKIISAITGL